eukprot:4024521-Amphidinium_carterae.1
MGTPEQRKGHGRAVGRQDVSAEPSKVLDASIDLVGRKASASRFRKSSVLMMSQRVLEEGVRIGNILHRN